jgi:nucleoid DNA-binding protein
MNKSDLAKALTDTEIPKGKEAADIVDLVFDGFMNTLKERRKI